MSFAVARAFKNAVVRTPLRTLALRQAAARKITVIAYHRVDMIPNRGYPYDGNRFSASPAEFAREIEFLRRHFDLISVTELITGIQTRSLPGRPAVLTFDDGYVDGYKTVLPILREAKLKACFLVPTGYLGTSEIPWWDQVACCFKFSSVTSFPSPFGDWDKDYECDLKWPVPEIERFTAVMEVLPWPEALGYLEELKARTRVHPRDFTEKSLFITWDQAREMERAGMEIGAQSRTRPVLEGIADETLLREEIACSFEDLKRELGTKPVAFGVPQYGGSAQADVVDKAIAESGFEISFLHSGSLASRQTDKLTRLGRFRSEFDENFKAFEEALTIAVLG